MDLIRKIYEPKQPKKPEKRYDLVVPIDYANLKPTGGSAEIGMVLPDASLKSVMLAAKMLKDGFARRMAWANTSIHSVSPYTLDLKKRELVKAMGIDSGSVQNAECTNTVTEAEGILKLVPDAESILIVCDWRHAPRALRIWQHFFKGEIGIVTIDGDWNRSHELFLCKSNLRFLLFNLAHHAALRILGVERLRNLGHKSH